MVSRRKWIVGRDESNSVPLISGMSFLNEITFTAYFPSLARIWGNIENYKYSLLFSEF